MPFVISSLRGAMNDTDPAIALPDDQAILCQNIEFIDSMLGERRAGSSAITLPSFIEGGDSDAAMDRVTFLFRHLPTSDETAAQLWVLGVAGTTTAQLGYKTTTWTEVTISDTPLLTGFTQYRWQAVSLHGKIHFAYDSDVNRLHVWDGTTMRRSGLTEPAAPTAADAGGAGTLSGVRYGRVRLAILSGSTVLLRGNPSDVLTHTPGGTNASITWTKPATLENATHWEIELSTDNANFYRMARIAVGTTTHTDSVAYTTGYSSGTLSEDIEDYALIPSAKYLTVDDDRLIWGGCYEDDSLASRVGWTPVYQADGVGNDERLETDTDPFIDLDTYENGELTGLSEPVLGAIWAFKQHAIYKLIRTGRRDSAYDAIKYTDALGAVHGSVVSGIDETGQPCIYFLDHEQGPCRLGYGGIKRCGEDIRRTWELINPDATAVVCSSLYYPKKKQVYWNIAVSGGNTPTKRLVLHTDKTRPYADGVRRGWAIWTGNIAKALTMCLFSDNIEANTTRSRRLVPFIGLEGLGLVHICDTGITDNAVAYEAKITTKPYWLKTVLQRFIVDKALLIAKAVASATIDVKCIRNFALETTSTVSAVSMAATGTETDVIKELDDFKGADLQTAQFQFVDVAAPAATWQLNHFAVREKLGEDI